jgi:hypothetical protein
MYTGTNKADCRLGNVVAGVKYGSMERLAFNLDAAEGDEPLMRLCSNESRFNGV